MTENLLQRGLELTVFGMGTVFVFLVMLIFATRGMSYLALRFGESVTTPSPASTLGTKTINNLEKTELIAVITAAIRQYRISNKK